MNRAAQGRFDVVSICSPTALHGEHLRGRTGTATTALIFCEKPVTPTVAETAHWVERCHDRRRGSGRQPHRRWDPDVRRLHDELGSGTGVHCAR